MIRWGVLSTAAIAADVVAAARDTERARFVAVASRDEEPDTVSAAIATGTDLPFGRADAVAQAGVLEAVARAAATRLPVEP